jgi:hypothetical protein
LDIADSGSTLRLLTARTPRHFGTDYERPATILLTTAPKIDQHHQITPKIVRAAEALMRS